ncbi:hypothetical protein AKL17_0106 [Frigidibacter mobilis]|uniref:Uncharacterized protein n=1 Tax=Frigidibacter mobilis TaxID=1335048 RepID=A0A159Z0F1_9RHOB|nr:hypothetical protein AKL17_0106 [Frigidibacter mobilis]
MVAPHPGAWIETWIRSPTQRAKERRPPPGGVDRNSLCLRRLAPQLASPPTRGRGSKRQQIALKDVIFSSPPTRGRGSKQGDLFAQGLRTLVAPHPGAWIETRQCAPAGQGVRRRPPPGGVDRNADRGRDIAAQARRPPPGGVDRNRAQAHNLEVAGLSPPTRGRGSKRRHLARGRRTAQVAPHPGAWIETQPGRIAAHRPDRRPPPGAWMKPRCRRATADAPSAWPAPSTRRCHHLSAMNVNPAQTMSQSGIQTARGVKT